MTTAKGLRVAPTLLLPRDAVTQTFALLAVRRAGKSNTGAVMAEEMFYAGLPWVAIDPKGDWWGLRSSADGTGPGLPVPIFGGLHGDMPLDPEAGRLMAELVVEHNLTCVLDVSRFSKAARARFLTEFAERLYELHQADPQPRHLFLEEADRVVPQQIMKADAYMARCLGAFSDIVRLGGSFGLGVTLISQRSAVISKDVLTQVETMIAMRTTSPQDRKAIRDWMEHHAIAAEIVDSLPGLASGEAWVSSSFFLVQHGQEAIQRVRFRQRATFDSGATPAIGRQRRVATLADIDLRALEAGMTAVIEKAARDDPVRLRRRITELERQLASRGSIDPRDFAELADDNAAAHQRITELEAREPERVEVPVLQAGEIAALEGLITDIRGVAAGVELALSRATVPARPVPVPPRPPAPKPARPVPRIAAAEGDAPALSRAQRAILTVLARFPEGRTRAQVATLSGYSIKSSGFANALGALRSAGLVNRGDPIQVTADGADALGGELEPLPSGDALVEYWMSRLGKAERTLLRVFLDAWPEPLTKDEAAERSGYSATSSGFANALGKLRTLELLRGWVADDTLAEQASGVTR